jgi:hypothetical protein
MRANHSKTRPNKPWLEEFLGKMGKTHRSTAVAGGEVSERENREIKSELIKKIENK